MEFLEIYKEQLEYIFVLIALLLPFYIMADFYNLIKTKTNYLRHVSILVLCGLFVTTAYLYLQPSQRYYIFLTQIAWMIIIIVISLLVKAFKRK